MTIPFDKLGKKWMADPKFREEYEKLAPQFELADELITARTRAKLSQEEVARRMGTTQSVVAKLESGRAKPSVRSLERYAAAIGARLKFKLLPA